MKDFYICLSPHQALSQSPTLLLTHFFPQLFVIQAAVLYSKALLPQSAQLDPCVLSNLYIMEEYDTYEGKLGSMEVWDAHPWPLQYYSGTSFCWCNLRRGKGWNQQSVAVWTWNLLSDCSSWPLSPQWYLSPNIDSKTLFFLPNLISIS